MSSTTMWLLEQGRGSLQTAQSRVAVTVDQLARGLSHVDASSDIAGIANLLGVRLGGFPECLPAAWLVDQYVRRNDLIVTYERPHPDHLRAQVYWRFLSEDLDATCKVAGSDSGVEGVHLIVSLQTDRLDQRPTLSVVSQLVADQILCLNDARDDTFRTVPSLPGAARDVLSADDRRAAVDRIQPLIQLGESSGAPVWLIRRDNNSRSLVLMTLPADLVNVAWRRSGTFWQHEFHLLDEHLEKGVIRRAQVVAWWVPRATDAQWSFKRFRQWLAAPPPLTT